MRLMGKDVSVAYLAKLILLSRQLFKYAVDAEILDRSPFTKIKPGSQKNPARQRFVTRDVIDRAIAVAPGNEWKLIIALARYGGLRIPTELLALKWSDVLWDKRRIIIRASKTEHHVGKSVRAIPLFPELKPLLLEAFDLAPVGAIYVINRSPDERINLRTQFQRILKRADIEPWPKLFQNLRSSRQTIAQQRSPNDNDDRKNDGNDDRGGTKKGGAKSGAVHAGFGSHDAAPEVPAKSASAADAIISVKVHPGAKTRKNTSMGAVGFEPYATNSIKYCYQNAYVYFSVQRYN
jgi:hypothetical protein